MSLDPSLLHLLCDPTDHGTLLYVASHDVLVNPRTNEVYAVRNDIAVLMPSEARVATADEVATLLEAGSVETGTVR